MPRRRPPAEPTLRRAARAAALAAALVAGGGALGPRGPVARAADAEPEDRPSLVRALFLERTARDPRAALEAYRRLVDDAATDAATRAEARLGTARCLEALGRAAEADAAWRALEDDAGAPPEARQVAREERGRRAAAARTAADAEAEARAEEALRRAASAQAERAARVEAATVLVEGARRHVREKRYEKAREDLLQALAWNPADAQAAALLEEVSAFGDRGDLLRQAIRFVATNRALDFRRLSADVDRRHRAALRLVREGKPDAAVASLVEAVRRIDESDFWADLAEPRRALVVLARKAIDDAKAAGLPLPAGTAVPADRPDPPAVKPWRREFYALLARVFGADDGAEGSVRFYDGTIPPNPTPDARGLEFSARADVGAAVAPGTLRRARFLEHWVREQVAPGSWTGKDRLLERYDDLLVVEHAPGALREVDAAAAAFPPGASPPVRLEARVWAAAPGGVADLVRLLDLRARPGEAGTAAVAAGHTLAEADRLLAASPRLRLLGTASVRLTGRHAAMLRFTEPTAASPWNAGDDPAAPLVVAARDATYGLDLDVYAEDLPGARGFAAVSAVATVRRPDRPRVLPLATGNTRVPTFLTAAAEADRRVPHLGALALLGLPNPFRETGAGGDASGGTHPDLVVLLGAAPAEAGAADAPPPAPPTPSGDGATTRELDLGALGEVEDEPPPDDWPSAPFADPSRLEAARRRRDAFLAGWLGERLGLAPGGGTLAVADGRVTATLPAADHARLAAEVARLVADGGRLFTVEVVATEVATDRAVAARRAAGLPAGDPAQRLWRLDEAAARRFEAALADAAVPSSLYASTTRLAARHTQLVTARAIRARSLVEEFRVSRGPDGTMHTVPVNGTAEEGLVVSVRPVASVGGLATLDVSAVLARIEKVEAWSPPDAPGGAPSVTLPRHRVEGAGGQGTFGDTDTILLAVPAPGEDGARTVLVRVRHVRP